MSYILSALQKAERQRCDGGSGEPPAAAPRSLESPEASPSPGAPPWRVPALAGAAVALTGLLVAALWGWSATNPPARDVPAADTVAARTPETSSNSPPAPGGGGQGAEAVASAAEIRTDTRASVSAKTPPVSRSEPPQLNITGYIYFDSDPEASKLFVDGVVHRLGSAVKPGVTIRAFRRNSVVLSRAGTRHEIAVP